MEPAGGVAAVESSSSTAAAPDQINIYCIYSANPMQLANEPPQNATRWFKDGKLLEVGASRGPSERLIESRTPTGYPTLTIARPTRRDAGAYECQVSNAIGSSERLPASEQLRVEVAHKPSARVRVRRLREEEAEADAAEAGAAAEGAAPPSGRARKLADWFDLDSDLVFAGARFELHCEVLEANPKKIIKFHWYSKEVNSQSSQWAHNVTDSDRLELAPLGSDFSARKLACAATNALGQGERSDSIELALSHAPGE